MAKLDVIELFAGVGGFRLGLEKTEGFRVVWSNQWEPSTKTQHASLVYEARFGSEQHSNQDIASVPTAAIPDADMLVGGFPCQDYSVATSLVNSKGLIGKKGVLWWSIHRILKEKENKPKYLFLENVDRLLKSPAQQRGRDFAIILKSLEELGYAVEWRVINAADYGMPQRRRRIFFLAYHTSSPLFESMITANPENWITQEGLFAQSFPLLEKHEGKSHFSLKGDLVSLSNGFNKKGKTSPFLNSGLYHNGKVFSLKTQPHYMGDRTVLSDILEAGPIDEGFYLTTESVPKWEYMKGAKKETRKTKAGFDYLYSEGAMRFPDPLDMPSRTIITGEGGKGPSRFKHVVHDGKGLRRLTPVELERLNMFPDHHTELAGITDAKRAFFMGNALVVGIVEQMAQTLLERLKE
ncbi:DNA (cytosine-5-)-methyltransferase [Sediminicola luteus]|uniref:Cytosine-specific methyltransferase n=1 Tax=Sediminicola luteus TaxID=319238 RepID=A0A2A4GF51_9FLAO|nr:DNA (cytosine-5-)-methyltransferase [Sediminicola luteus]PCE66610.1 DNA (cytosine-5-)-methyltransferase [Sediminicola luteus]